MVDVACSANLTTEQIAAAVQTKMPGTKARRKSARRLMVQRGGIRAMVHLRGKGTSRTMRVQAIPPTYAMMFGLIGHLLFRNAERPPRAALENDIVGAVTGKAMPSQLRVPTTPRPATPPAAQVAFQRK